MRSWIKIMFTLAGFACGVVGSEIGMAKDAPASTTVLPHPCVRLFLTDQLFDTEITATGLSSSAPQIIDRYTLEDVLLEDDEADLAPSSAASSGPQVYNFARTIGHLRQAKKSLYDYQQIIQKLGPRPIDFSYYQILQEHLKSAYDHLEASYDGQRLALQFNQRVQQLLQKAADHPKMRPFTYRRGSDYLSFFGIKFRPQDFAQVDSPVTWPKVADSLQDLIFDFQLPLEILGDNDVIYRLNKPNADDLLIRKAILHYYQYQKTHHLSPGQKAAFYAAIEQSATQTPQLSLVNELKFLFAPKYAFSFAREDFPLLTDHYFNDSPDMLEQEKLELQKLIKKRADYLQKNYLLEYQKQINDIQNLYQITKSPNPLGEFRGLPELLANFDRQTDFVRGASATRLLYTPENYQRLLDYLRQQQLRLKSMLTELGPYLKELRKMHNDSTIVVGPFTAARLNKLDQTVLRSPKNQKIIKNLAEDLRRISF